MTGPPMPRAHTRADVARLAGTSTAVVSYVLNGGPRPVAPATRARVQRAIEALGYRPDRVAQALSSRRSRTFGLVVPDITNPFMSDVSRAVEAAASAAGYNVLLANSGIDTGRERTLLQQLIDSRVAGILLIAVGPDEPTVRELTDSGVPVVVVDRPVGALGAVTVVADNAGGARTATNHLADHGHRRIACITGPSGLWPAAERERGWAEVIAERGLPRRGCTVTRTGVSRRAGYEAAVHLLGLGRPPTAVFVATDEQAFGVVRAAADSGRRVPDDLAVVSFDGIAQAAFSVPGLTTVRQPVDDMALAAVGALITGGHGTLVHPVTLVLRGSCGCPEPSPFSSDDKR